MDVWWLGRRHGQRKGASERSLSLDRELFALALPALATLVAEPLLVLADSAIIGHVSTRALAGLGVASSVIGLVLGLSVFLAYGTTATVSRRLGAGDVRAALSGGLDGMSLSVIIGILLSLGLGLGADTIAGWYGVEPAVAAGAAEYLRHICWGLPFALVMLAATGVLRGLQDTRTPLVAAITMNLINVAASLTLVLGLGWGLAGAGTATAASQAAVGTVLAGVVARKAAAAGVRWRWQPVGVLVAARSGGWLVLRTLGLQASLVATTTVAARMGATTMAAHQVTNSLWMLLVYGMDAIAIAAQAMVGRYLGAGDAATVQLLLRRMLGWASILGFGAGLLAWATSPVYLPLFSPDPQVQSQVASLLPLVVVLTLLGASVFTLDGVLIGAGDVRYLALASLANLLSYLPLLVLVSLAGAGLWWLWLAYGGLLASRLVVLALRAGGGRWLRLGL